jgi:NADH-quinone oxidoreductase subunit H
MFSMSAIAATLFLGGWYLPGLSLDVLEFAGPLILMGKVSLLVFLIIWFRWTFPRLREDQLQSLAWRWLIPLALLNIVGTAVAKVVF